MNSYENKRNFEIEKFDLKVISRKINNNNVGNNMKKTFILQLCLCQCCRQTYAEIKMGIILGFTGILDLAQQWSSAELAFKKTTNSGSLLGGKL